MDSYDLIVIGAGTGGLRTALAAAHKGKKTLLLEPGKIGGTCLNNGCIPTKAMIEAAHRYAQLSELKEFGITVSKPKLTMTKLMQRVKNIVQEGQDHIRPSLNHQNLTVVKKKGVFVDTKTIKAGTKTYTAKKIIIATGASNTIPPIDGLHKVPYLTNETIFNLKKIPNKIAMIGCGYISMEFATFFNFIGTKVVMLEFCDHILSQLDEDAAHLLKEHYESKGVQFLTSTVVTKARKTSKGIELTYKSIKTAHEKEKTILVDEVLVATGRHPNTKDLDLEQTGVKLGARKEITINKFLQTSHPDIFAIGDVTGKTMFAHAVKRASSIALNNAFSDGKKAMPFDLVPWAVFTDPVVSGIGLNEDQLQQQKIKYNTYFARFNRVGRAKIMNDQLGFVKIHYKPTTRKILGATIMGPRADDLLHEIAVLINSKQKVDVILDTIHIHPTISEVMANLRSH